MTVPRWRMLLLRVLTALLLMAVGAILGAQLLFIGMGTIASQRGDHLAAHDAYHRAERVSLVARWVAPFNRGVANYELRRWDAAVLDFALATQRAPEDQQCMVRLNWAQALEASADGFREQDDLAGALVRYQEALVVLSLAQCPEDATGADGGSLSEQWRDARQRLDQKSRTTGEAQPQEQQHQTQVDPQAELDEREQQAQQERQRAEDAADGQTSGEGQRTW